MFFHGQVNEDPYYWGHYAGVKAHPAYEPRFRDEESAMAYRKKMAKQRERHEQARRINEIHHLQHEIEFMDKRKIKMDKRIKFLQHEEELYQEKLLKREGFKRSNREKLKEAMEAKIERESNMADKSFAGHAYESFEVSSHIEEKDGNLVKTTTRRKTLKGEGNGEKKLFVQSLVEQKPSEGGDWKVVKDSYMINGKEVDQSEFGDGNLLK